MAAKSVSRHGGCWIYEHDLYNNRQAANNSPGSTRSLCLYKHDSHYHYCDAIMGIVAFQITSLTIVYTTVYSDADQSKHQSCASLAFVWGIHRGPVNSPHKWPVTRKMFPFDDVIMEYVVNTHTSDTTKPQKRNGLHFPLYSDVN